MGWMVVPVMEVVPMMNVRVVMEGVGMSIPIDYNILLWKIIVAFGVLCDAVVRADASGDLSRGHARYLEATFLFHLSSAWRKRLCLQLSLRKEVQALWRRRLWSRQRRCCRRWRLEQRRRRKILGRWGTTTNAGTCCIESRGAATTTAPSREHCRVRHLPSTNVCSGRGRGRGGGGLGRLVHCAGYRGAEEASAISFGTVIFVFKTPRRKTGPDAPPGAIPPPPPSQPKALAASAFEGELREGRMNEGEQNSRGPEGGTPSVLRHSLFPLASHPPLYSASRGVRGRREGKTRGGGRLGEGVGKPRNAHLLRTTPKPPPPLLPPRRRRPLQNPPGRSARRRRRRASVAFPSPPPAPPPPANPELSVAQTSPPGPAGPARPSPHALRTLSNPLGSRLLLREETLAAAGAGAARLEAGRRRGAGYATGRGRARRDAGSSRSTAGARRRRWQREPRDLSITGSHGARAFSSLWAGASARHTSSGRKGPAPEPPRRAAGLALAPTMRAALVLFLCSRFVRTPLLPWSGREGAAGGGGDSFLGGVGGQRGCCSDCSRRRSKEREHHEFQFPGVRRRHDMSQAFSSARGGALLLLAAPGLDPGPRGPRPLGGCPSARSRRVRGR
ncbi:hypothetical protein EI555_009566, partial [Monodon monoceros]